MDVEQQIRQARVRSIYERLWGTSLITIFNAALMTAVLQATGAPEGTWLWLTLVTILATARLANWLLYRRYGVGLTDLAVWEVAVVGGSLLSGILWGIGAITLSPDQGAGQLLWVFLIGGMCAGAAGLHAAHRLAALAYIVPAGLPLAIQLAIQGSERQLAAAVMIVIFVVALSMTTNWSSRQFGRTVRLQAELEQRGAELDAVNARLSREIADHRHTGEYLRQAQKMEALGQLTGGVAHDFNNLLTVIAGNLELMIGRAAGNQDIIRLATAAGRAAERGGRLTASLLSFARKQSLRPERIDVNALIREFEPFLRRAVGEAVAVELVLGPGLHLVDADSAHFQSALLNLAINARDATVHGMRLTVTTQNVTLTQADLAANADARPGTFVAITVRDTGVGMMPEVAAKAFEPFFTTKDAGKGSGLGLSQVYGFARQSGGHTTIDSKPGGGTAVSIFLPVHAGAQAEPTAATGPLAATPDPAMRVLLVEDDAELLAMLQESLTLNGWSVTAVADGRAALGVLEGSAEIDILVTDVVMPVGVSGIDLARSAARTRPNLPVVLMSGYPTATLAAQDASEDEFDLLRKPFSSTQLIARMQSARNARNAVAEQGPLRLN